LRNSHPDREKLSSWFELNLLPMEIIEEALEQCVDIGFTGGVWLSHYNEPLMDKRIPHIAEMVKSFGQFSMVALNTNGDFINEELAEELDGKVDKMIVTLYMDEPTKSYRKDWIKSLFHSTYVEIITMSDHIPTHFSPAFDVKALAEKHKNRPCSEPQMRVVINHRQQYLLCCDDVIGNFDLGTFPETSIRDYWFGEKHMNIMNNLKNTGGRLLRPYCATCPRP
jgi:hypothetical protein